MTWVSTKVEPDTRTVKARIELPNEEGLLRANMFGTAKIFTSPVRQTIMVPKSAVQWEGCCNVAFLEPANGGTSFQTVALTLLASRGDQYEVGGGLRPGDSVVTEGSFILKNELLKDAVGAGCCEVGHLDQ